MARTPEPLPSWEELIAWFAEAGIEHVGVASADVLWRARAELRRRAELGYDAGMGFTYRNPERSTDPQRAVENAKSVIVAAVGYGADQHPPPPPGSWGRVARYGWNDYYEPLRTSLRAIAKRLRAAGERAVAFADDNSIVDREVAYLGGLGWFGKNANVLVKGVGSYVVLGSILTTAHYPSAQPVADGCGTCHRCIDECPTGAIVAPGVIDGNRCLAWLVQKPGTFPLEFREALGDRFYGCDDCQESCPPTVRLGDKGKVDLQRLGAAHVNERRINAQGVNAQGVNAQRVNAQRFNARGTTTRVSLGRTPGRPVEPSQGSAQLGEEPGQLGEEPGQLNETWVDLMRLLDARDDDLIERYGRWYLADRDPRWWRRNALIVLGNRADPHNPAVTEVIERYEQGDDTLLAEHASWARTRVAKRLADSVSGAAD